MLCNSYLQSAFFASSLSNATQYAPGQPPRTVVSEVHIDHRELRGDLEDDDDGKAALIAISGETIARAVTMKWRRL